MKRPGSVRVTPLGWILLVLIPTLIAVALVSSERLRFLAFAACGVLVLGVVLGASGFGQAREAGFARRWLARDPKAPEPEAMNETYDADAWRRERERREQNER